MRWGISKLLYKTNFILINKTSTFFCRNVKYFTSTGMELKEVVKVLEEYAPQRLAADWDNVGLLLEPSSLIVHKLMLTNDFTLKVII